MEKLIFMLLSPIWVIVEDLNGKVEHFVHEMWPQTCDRIGFKFYKMQMNSENHEICLDVMISYEEVVIKNWECFAKVVTYVDYETKYPKEVYENCAGFVKLLSQSDDRIEIWFQNFLYRQESWWVVSC